jgi:hypothetical protein
MAATGRVVDRPYLSWALRAAANCFLRRSALFVMQSSRWDSGIRRGRRVRQCPAAGWEKGSACQTRHVRPWWARNPWQGLPFRERRRLERLSRSGRPINDPQDNQRVRGYVASMNRLYRGRFWRFVFVFLPWVIAPAFLAGSVVRAIRGNVGGSLWYAAVAVGWLLIFFQLRNLRQKMERTAEVNGWAESVA